MKHLKKIMALVIAMVMVLSMSAVVFADDPVTPTKNDSITVNNTISGETYSIYKMFDLSVNNEYTPTAYRYTVNSAWTEFFTGTGAGAAYVTIDTTDSHIEWSNSKSTDADSTDMIAFAQAAAAYAANTSALDSKEASGSSVVFSSLEDGYYLITSTLGTKAMIETTPDASAVSITEKNPEDTIEKKVQEDSNGTWGESNDAQIGDTVNFRSTAKIYPYTRNVFIHDTMDDGLDYQNNVTIDGLTAGTDYTVLASPQGTDTFTIQISDDYIKDLTGETELVLTYSAKLTTAAVNATPAIVDQKNKTKITYGDKQSVEDETTTTTHKFSVYKHETGATDNLAGAIFQLKKGSDIVKLTKINDNNYRVNPDGAETTFTTVATGDIVIWGVDADNDYSLVETQAPAGYNKLASPVSVTVDAGNETQIDVANSKGTELPSTGGIGTTIFYVIGAILVLGAGILLVTRRRVSAN